jgi:hypothetical protein
MFLFIPLDFNLKLRKTLNEKMFNTGYMSRFMEIEYYMTENTELKDSKWCLLFVANEQCYFMNSKSPHISSKGVAKFDVLCFMSTQRIKYILFRIQS